MDIIKYISLARNKDIFFEFLRYVLVGGVSFVVDFGVMVFTYEYILWHFTMGVYLATGLGFFFGLLVNYFLSVIFVFKTSKLKDKRYTVTSFLVFGIIGGLGLAWTELGMWVGVQLIMLNYKVTKIIVTVFVLFWNYLGRKLIIFK